jgi:hypothetical protein
MKTKHLLINSVLLAALLLAGCSPRLRVGALQSESQTVELDDADAVRVKMLLGAGDLAVSGGSEKLLEADFTYNVAKMKPEVKSTDGSLVISHPDVRGYRTLQDITEFRNEWDLRFNDDVPMNLSLDMGAGNSNLQLADLSLTGLDILLGAGKSTVDLSNDWAHDLEVTFDSGAADITVRLPKAIGVRVEVEAGPTVINAPGLMKKGNIYTNAAYSASDVTLQINIKAGIGAINLLEID